MCDSFSGGNKFYEEINCRAYQRMKIEVLNFPTLFLADALESDFGLGLR